MKKITLKDFQRAVNNGLSVCHVDVETSISKFYGFNSGKQYVAPESMVPGTETKVMTIQYKFEGDEKTKYLECDWIEHPKLAKLKTNIKSTIYHSLGTKLLKQSGLLVMDDSKILEEFTINILPKIHILVGQNIDSFDYKVLNDRIMMQQLTPIDHDLSIDILKLSRKSFRKISHRLDNRSKLLGFGGKHRVERADWTDIIEGKAELKDKIIPYGLKDVDDEQGIMYKEFNYYKRLPVKIERIIKEFLIEDLKPICHNCEKNKKHKFDVSVLNNSKLGIKYQCNFCSNVFKLEKY